MVVMEVRTMQRGSCCFTDLAALTRRHVTCSAVVRRRYTTPGICLRPSSRCRRRHTSPATRSLPTRSWVLAQRLSSSRILCRPATCQRSTPTTSSSSSSNNSICRCRLSAPSPTACKTMPASTLSLSLHRPHCLRHRRTPTFAASVTDTGALQAMTRGSRVSCLPKLPISLCEHKIFTI